MIKRIRITPKFNVQKIINKAINKKWFIFQEQVFSLGHEILAYMQNYINANTKRSGSTGNLAKSMTLEVSAGAGTGKVFWGIGNMEILNTEAKYWYVVNFGKMITGQPYVPYHGKRVPGSFNGNVPDSSLTGNGSEQFNKGDGSGFSMSAKTPIRPMSYIQASRHQLDVKLRMVLASLRRG